MRNSSTLKEAHLQVFIVNKIIGLALILSLILVALGRMSKATARKFCLVAAIVFVTGFLARVVPWILSS